MFSRSKELLRTIGKHKGKPKLYIVVIRGAPREVNYLIEMITTRIGRLVKNSWYIFHRQHDVKQCSGLNKRVTTRCHKSQSIVLSA